MIEISVDIELVKRCHKKAVAVVDNNMAKGYRETYSLGAKSRAESIAICLMGFIAESATCLYLGLDPAHELTWRTERPDGGFDIRCGTMTIDVKASEHPYASRLMWPVKKLDKLPGAADIFVLARVPKAMASREGQRVQLCGWVTRDEFILKHDKAAGIGGIVDGTPFMNQNSLYSMEQLVQHLGHEEATKESHHG